MDNNVENNINSEFNGLTAAEVNARIEAGKINIADDSSDRTTGKIIRDNLLTYFNLIFLVITVLLCIAGAFRDLTFLPIIIGNILIGIVQELRAKKTLDKMKILNAGHAVVIREGKRQKVTAEELVIDDLVWLSSGDAICADSVVVSGEITVNESMLTGEADGIVKKENEELLSGSFVVSGEGYARLTRVGNDSYISKLTNEAKALKKGEESEMIRSINMFVKVIGIIIIPMSVILFVQAFVFRNASFRTSITSMVASIIGLIPEGLYLLTTLALAVSMMKLAKDKVLLHDMKSIESLARVDVLCVDKTGTITEGKPVVTGIYPAKDITEEELLHIAGSLEYNSEHPLAGAVNQEIEKRKITISPVKNFNALPGNGLLGEIDGVIVMGGNYRFISGHTADKEELKNISDKVSNEGKTPLIFAKDNHYIGTIAVADTIKEDSHKAVSELKKMGIHVVMLTGDNEKTAAIIGKEAGVDEVIAGVLPDGKENVIRELMKKGRTAMVGDGINDAPALTRADIGIAIGAGTDIAIDAADVVLMKSRLTDVAASIRLSKSTLRNIHENLFWAFFYNTIGIPLAAGAFVGLGLTLNPMFGAAAMSLSSFCVVTNALRLNLADIYGKRKKTE